MANQTQRARTANPHLARELVQLEQRVAGLALLLCVGGLILSAGVALAVDRKLGLLLVGFCAALVGWFQAVRLVLGRELGARWMPALSPFIEGSLPTALVLIDLAVRGPVYALDVPTVPQFYAAFVLLQGIRLRRWLPLAVAAWSGAQYLLVYAVALRPALSEVDSADPRGPWLVATRAAVLLLTGAVGTAVSRGLRHAVGNAEQSRRAEELFGKYRLGARIATGGMGEVYRATYCPEGGFERPVALKRISPRLAQEANIIASFRSEAALCSRLLHPNIVQVLDFGRVEDTFFLSMEFVEGGTLNHLGERARRLGVPVPERVVVQLGRDILAGLTFAHDEARGEDGQLLRVLHRDLNPPNVLLTRAGDAKVSDFGIARSVGAAAELVTATVVGKSAYMSPEQARAEPQDRRSDLFAVAIILWELAAGRRLFSRGTDASNLLAIVSEDAPPPSRYRPLDPAWDGFFARALARAPSERFPSAATMREALTALAPGDLPRPDEVVAFLDALDAAELTHRPPPDVDRDSETKPLPGAAGA